MISSLPADSKISEKPLCKRLYTHTQRYIYERINGPKYVQRVSQSTTKAEVASRLCRKLNPELETREGIKRVLSWRLRSLYQAKSKRRQKDILDSACLNSQRLILEVGTRNPIMLKCASRMRGPPAETGSRTGTNSHPQHEHFELNSRFTSHSIAIYPLHIYFITC